eukprot:2365400-Prymnesium_polylepis.1
MPSVTVKAMDDNGAPNRVRIDWPKRLSERLLRDENGRYKLMHMAEVAGDWKGEATWQLVAETSATVHVMQLEKCADGGKPLLHSFCVAAACNLWESGLSDVVSTIVESLSRYDDEWLRRLRQLHEGAMKRLEAARTGKL